ncbi:hypothetical protein [Wolbachia endosymbiont of Ctenocephalides felis wCfeT]|uniref:hypothetical protein n=1 Tax=Wolbachia endosymbiont of Ctenocephalides felis wCfeT TaxID=2732593 RepID=UPI0014455D4F|nr:hypothetical protein [Wolbachia endosymbiont of Ctenocephalides felis wCfeT]
MPSNFKLNGLQGKEDPMNNQQPIIAPTEKDPNQAKGSSYNATVNAQNSGTNLPTIAEKELNGQLPSSIAVNAKNQLPAQNSNRIYLVTGICMVIGLIAGAAIGFVIGSITTGSLTGGLQGAIVCAVLGLVIGAILSPCVAKFREEKKANDPKNISTGTAVKKELSNTSTTQHSGPSLSTQ